MDRPLGSWKLFLLALLVLFPAGLWLFEHIPHAPSAAYAQQQADAQQARVQLDPASIASAESLSKVFRDVSKSVKPAVVSIKSLVNRPQVARNNISPFRGLPPEFEQFFGDRLRNPQDQGDDEDEPQTPSGKVQLGLGSGVIVRSDGYILTNNHVVKDAAELEVYLSDESKYVAKVIGTDPNTDLAVIKIEATGLVSASLGDSSKADVGDWVLAIGSPFGLAQTVTAGIISATNRSDQGITLYDSFIQTDAAINPGNSGGPLLNLRGEVIGINTAIASRSGGYNGVCFAIPSNTATRILNDIIKTGTVSRGFIGVRPGTLTPEVALRMSLPENQRGAVVEQVTKGQPAEKAGIKVGDVIIAIDNNPITSDSSMRRTIGEMNPGTTVKIHLLRNGKPIDIPVTITAMDMKALMASDQQNKENVEKYGIAVDLVPSEVASKLDLQEGEGVLVRGIDRRSKFVGVKVGNVILSVNGQKVSTPEEFFTEVGNLKKGGALTMVVRSADSETMITIK